jgi:hypothetical protein
MTLLLLNLLAGLLVWGGTALRVGRVIGSKRFWLTQWVGNLFWAVGYAAQGRRLCSAGPAGMGRVPRPRRGLLLLAVAYVERRRRPVAAAARLGPVEDPETRDRPAAAGTGGMMSATNTLHYRGDLTADLEVGAMLGGDSTGYPYQVASAGYRPADGRTAVGLEPWPLEDMAGFEREIRRRRAPADEANRLYSALRGWS